MKETYASKNQVGGYDLMTERDSGNKVRILTGRYTISLEFWQQLKNLCDKVLFELDNVNEDQQSEELLP